MAHQAFCQAISSPPLDKASSGQGLWRQGTPSKVVVSLYFIRLIVCTRMCIYIYTYTHMYHLYLYIYIYTHTPTHTIYVLIFLVWFVLLLYAFKHTYIYIHTYIWRERDCRMCVCVYTYIYIFIYLFIYLYVYKYTVFTYSLRVWGWLSKCFIVPGASLFQHSEASTAKARCLSPITQNMESCEHLVLQGHKLGHAGHPKPYPPSSCTQSP